MVSYDDIKFEGGMIVSTPKDLHQSTRNILLLSDKIIEVSRDIISMDTPLECNVILNAPLSMDMDFLERRIKKVMTFHQPFSKIKLNVKNHTLCLNLISGSNRCSFCRKLLEYLDSSLEQELILIDDRCPEWRPVLKEKIGEDEYGQILKNIRKKRLEYFGTTEKYRDEVLKRDNYKCLSCGGDGQKLYTKKNGKKMHNPLQIHHMSYSKDSPDSLITLCMVCHFKLHRRLYLKTGQWSSKEEDMKLIEDF